MNFISFDIPFEEWKALSNYNFNLRLKYNQFKRERKLNKSELFEIKKKLKILQYLVWLTSPHLKNNIEKQKEVYLDCFNDLKMFQERNNRI